MPGETGNMTSEAASSAHWDRIYARGDTTRSWYQAEPVASLAMLDAAGVSPHDSVIDVGGGASTLVDELLRRGFADVSVLDISPAGLALARRRLGADAARVRWLVQDVLAWRPPRRYQVWHDRAVFHFLTTDDARRRYLRALHAATGAHALAVFRAARGQVRRPAARRDHRRRVGARRPGS